MPTVEVVAYYEALSVCSVSSCGAVDHETISGVTVSRDGSSLDAVSREIDPRGFLKIERYRKSGDGRPRGRRRNVPGGSGGPCFCLGSSAYRRIQCLQRSNDLVPFGRRKLTDPSGSRGRHVRHVCGISEREGSERSKKRRSPNDTFPCDRPIVRVFFHILLVIVLRNGGVRRSLDERAWHQRGHCVRRLKTR